LLSENIEGVVQDGHVLGSLCSEPGTRVHPVPNGTLSGSIREPRHGKSSQIIFSIKGVHHKVLIQSSKIVRVGEQVPGKRIDFTFFCMKEFNISTVPMVKGVSGGKAGKLHGYGCAA
jgi:hypothetical protein